MGSDGLRRLLGSGSLGWFLLGTAVPGTALTGCASQQATAQALTVVGAAAVVVGASMAADEQCYAASESGGGPGAYCSPALSSGGRKVATGVAVAGVGLAAAGYALTPKGPDRFRPAQSDPALPPTYRLIRAAPEALPAPEGGSSEPREASAPPSPIVPSASCVAPATLAPAAPAQGGAGQPACAEPTREAPARSGAGAVEPR
jgi:hypothetical protein